MSYLRIGDIAAPTTQAERDRLAALINQGAQGGGKSWESAIATFFGLAPKNPVVLPETSISVSPPVSQSEPGMSTAAMLMIGAGVLGAAAYFIAKRK